MDEIINKTINERTNETICVIGLGYVGLPLACLSSKHFEVFGYDIDEDKINKINNHICPLNDSYLNKVFKTHSIKATNNPEVISQSDIILICVPTPIDENHKPNLIPLKSAAELVSKNLKKGQLIIVESTIYPGTTEEVVIPILEQSGLKAGIDFGVAYCPERIDPGNEKWVLENISRVLSALNEENALQAKKFYSTFINAEIKILKSLKSAEAVKILENTFRDINIAFINEVAKSFNSLGIDLIEVIEGASSKPFGFMPFYPGPGVGGHCIPVDPYYLIERAKANNFDHQFLKLAREINLSMPNYVVNILQKELNKLSVPIENSKIGVYGLAYKKNVDDIRESPSLKIIQLIKELGAEVKVYDPFVKSESDFNNLNEFLAHIDHLIIATDHDEILKSNPQNFEEKNIKLIIDCKSNLDQKDFNSTICKGIGK